MPADDMFWGDRYGKIADPFGHEWSFSTPLTAEQKAAAEKKWADFKFGGDKAVA
jgi:PhnB protein